MKKIALLIFMFGLFLSSNAQDKTYAMPTNKISGLAYTFASTDNTVTTQIPDFTSSDFVSNLDSTYSILIYPNQDVSYEYLIALTLDSVSGGGLIDSITLQGRDFNTDYWTTITNKTWYMSTSDTTIKFSGLITGTLIADTTKQMEADTVSHNLYYYVFEQKTKYRQLRLYVTCKNTVALKAKFDELEIKFIK